MSVRIERVTTVQECELCGQLANAIWGNGVACSSAQMIVHVNYGGIVLLAYDEGNPIGFLFSFPALYKGEWVLWSHETGILQGAHHRGIGADLKRTQRKLAAEMGYDTIAWTYDPLVARNAYFNLVKLGARVDAYKVNAYGINAGDLINQGIETDRFVTVWPVAGDCEGSSGGDSDARARTVMMADAAAVTAVPPDFTALSRRDAVAAQKMRLEFREAALGHFAVGLRPTQYVRMGSGGGQYLWTKEATADAD